VVEAVRAEATRRIAPDTADLATADAVITVLVTAEAVIAEAVTAGTVIAGTVTAETVTADRVTEHLIAPAAITIAHRSAGRIRQQHTMGVRPTATTPPIRRIAGRADIRVAAAVQTRRATTNRRLRRISDRIRAEDAVQRQLCGTLSSDSVTN
jgi:hypothetical protein